MRGTKNLEKQFLFSVTVCVLDVTVFAGVVFIAVVLQVVFWLLLLVHY